VKPSASNRKRARKAYRVTAKILVSYVSILLARRILGKSFYINRIDQVHAKNAQRIRAAILELQGLFTKVGQLLSVMSNILPKQYMEVLESLQDDAPASPFSETKNIIEAQLEESIETLFSVFPEEPIASASIGQVYKAQLHSGEYVAVKVQHAHIKQIAEADLKIIEQLIKRISLFITIGGIEHVYTQVRSMIEEELNYTKEAESMRTIGQNLSDEKGIIVPKVYTEYSSEKILVTTFYDAVKINDRQQIIEWGLNPHEIAERLVLVYCKMILEDGLYHADPHPGNVLVDNSGNIILLDFGAVATLNEEMRKEIPVILQAIIRKDDAKVLASMKRMGFVGDDKDSQKIASKFIAAVSQFIRNEVEIDNLNFKDISIDDIKGSSLDELRKEISIKELTKTIQVPKDWILLERALVLVIGTSASLEPDYRAMDTIKPYLKKLVIKDGGLKNIIIDTIKQQFTMLLSLPGELSTFLQKANSGELELEVHDSGTKIYMGIQQLILCIMFIGFLFFHHETHQLTYLIIAILFGVLLLRSFWRNR